MPGKELEVSGDCSKKCAPRVGVVVHFFYFEQAEKIIALLKQIPFEFDLYATAPEEGKGEAIRSLLAGSFRGKKIAFREVRNRGFDIAPFVCDFKDVYHGYDLILKLHTKKSAHTLWLRGWGSYLLANAAGSPEIVNSIVKMFDDDSNLGLVYPEIVPPLRIELKRDAWQENWEICLDLSSRLGLSVTREMSLDFPAGSMFWFRPKALDPLFKLGLVPGDFPEGKRIRRNGTLAHAVERLLVLIAAKEGFGSRTVCFEPFNTVRDMSVTGRLLNRAYGEWKHLMDLAGINL